MPARLWVSYGVRDSYGRAHPLDSSNARAPDKRGKAALGVRVFIGSARGWRLAGLGRPLVHSVETKLPARAHHVLAARDADEGRDALLAKNILKSQDAFERGLPVGQARASVVRNEIDFGGKAPDQMRNACGVRVGVVDARVRQVCA